MSIFLIAHKFIKIKVYIMCLEATRVQPQHIPTLENEDAKKFIKQDKKPLSKAQIEHLKHCLEIYNKNPIK